MYTSIKYYVKHVDANLDAPDNAISDNESSSEMLVSVLWILTFEQRMVI